MSTPSSDQAPSKHSSKTSKESVTSQSGGVVLNLLDTPAKDLPAFEVPTRLQWDLQLGLPLLHVSFALDQLFPRRYVRMGLTKWNLKRYEDEVAREFTDTTELKAELAGSIPEGFGVPTSFLRSSKKVPNSLEGAEFSGSDSDIVIVINAKTATFSSKDTGANYIVETDFCYPGYCRLLLKNPEKTGEKFKFKKAGCSDYYLSSDSLVADITARFLKSSPATQDPDMEVSRHGPAVTVEYGNQWKSRTIDRDFVTALECQSWPPEGHKWLGRQTKSGWPSQSLKEELSNVSCLVVAAPHKSSTFSSVEWRISFTRHERLLAQSLTDTHRHCYVLLKILVKHVLSPLSIISSYHLKTLLFWCAEKVPWDLWVTKTQEGFAAGFLLLLDELLICMSRGNLPHYIFTANNLFVAIPPDFLIDACKRVSWLRQNLIEAIISFDKVNAFFFSMSHFPLETLLVPLLVDAETAYDDVTQAYQTYCLLLKLRAKVYVASMNTDEIIDSFRELSLIQRIVCANPVCFVSLSMELADSMPPPISVLIYERLIQRFYQHEEIPKVRCKVASLYHALAYTRSTATVEKESLIEKAKDQFTLGLQSLKGHTSSWIDYVMFLFKENQIEEAISVAKKVFKMKLDECCFNKYSKRDRFALEGHLEKDVLLDGTLTVPTEALTLYLLVQSLAKACKTTEAREYCSLLTHACTHKWSEHPSLRFSAMKLLGYACLTVGKEEEAVEAFMSAQEMMKDSKSCSAALSFVQDQKSAKSD